MIHDVLHEKKINHKSYLQQFYRGEKCKTCEKPITKKNTSGYCKKHNYWQHSKTFRKKSSIAKLKDKNPNWLGEKVGYNALHGWIRRRLKKPSLCNECKSNEPYDMANISGKYKRDINDFEWLCRRCHMLKDGRMKRVMRGLNSRL